MPLRGKVDVVTAVAEEAAVAVVVVEEADQGEEGISSSLVVLWDVPSRLRRTSRLLGGNMGGEYGFCRAAPFGSSVVMRMLFS
jgi:hypothetical protein